MPLATRAAPVHVSFAHGPAGHAVDVASGADDKLGRAGKPPRPLLARLSPRSRERLAVAGLVALLLAPFAALGAFAAGGMSADAGAALVTGAFPEASAPIATGDLHGFGRRAAPTLRGAAAPAGDPPVAAFDSQPAPPRVRAVSVSPRAFLYEGLLTPEECDHLIALAKRKMHPSTVVDSSTGGSVDSHGIRTSQGMFLTRGQDDVVARVEEKIANFSGVSAPHGEGLQILHYGPGQKYDAHHDYFHDKVNAAPSRGGQRIATVLTYLTDVAEGGETVFPKGKSLAHAAKDSDASECALQGAAVKPKRGSALLFFSVMEDGNTPDPNSLHGACPVIRGDKWAAVKWMRAHNFGHNK